MEFPVSKTCADMFVMRDSDSLGKYMVVLLGRVKVMLASRCLPPL
jgi:hypothetical protein